MSSLEFYLEEKKKKEKKEKEKKEKRSGL